MLNQVLSFGAKVVEYLRQKHVVRKSETRTRKLMRLIEPLCVGVLLAVYFLGLSQLMEHAGGSKGTIAASVLAILMVALFLLFTENAFIGRSLTVRWVARVCMATFMVVASLLTGGLAYEFGFGKNNADRQAFGAIQELQTYMQVLSGSYTVASDRFGRVATLSASRAVDEQTKGGTCGEATNGIPGVRSSWRNEFAQAAKADSDEIASRAKGIEALSAEAKEFGAHFNPNDISAMQGQWADLVGRLQAADADGRVGQIVGSVQDRLNKADRNIGTETRGSGKPHVVTCSDGELRALSEDAIGALKAIKPMPKISNVIVGVDLETAWHRILAMVGRPFGLSSESVSGEEYVVFVFALAIEFLFASAKWIDYSHREGPDEPAAPPIMAKIAALFRKGGARHAFMGLKKYVLERSQRRYRMAIPYGAQHQTVMDCLDLLVAEGKATHVDDKTAADLTEEYYARIGANCADGKFSLVAVFDVPAHKWEELIRASASVDREPVSAEP